MKKQQLKVINPVADVNLFTVSLITQGMQSPKWKKRVGFYFVVAFSQYKKNFVNWHVDYCFWKKLGKAFFNEVLKSRKFPALVYKKHKYFGQRMYRQSGWILQNDLSKLSNRQIADRLKRLVNDFKDICFWGVVPAAIDFENNLLTGRLEEIIAQVVNKKKLTRSPQEILSLLSTPREIVFSQQEKRDLLKLAMTRPVTQVALEKHQQKYDWVDFGYIGPAHPIDYYQKRLRKIWQKKESPARKLKQLNKDHKMILVEQKRLARKLKLGSHTEYLLKLSRQFMYLKPYRKELMSQAYYAFEKILKEISSRFNYSQRQLQYCIPEEVLKILRGKKVNKKELNTRLKSEFLHVFEKNKNYFYYGKKAKKIISDNLYKEKIDTSLQEIRGMAAYMGKVNGTVRVVNTIAQMKKVKKGDILVSIATSPNILPAMIKAAAFVTDTGGVTCHAAIVAREMKKPCLIGTKIATRVFKDGDKVVVDAVKGVVKKL